MESCGCGTDPKSKLGTIVIQMMPSQDMAGGYCPCQANGAQQQSNNSATQTPTCMGNCGCPNTSALSSTATSANNNICGCQQLQELLAQAQMPLSTLSNCACSCAFPQNPTPQPMYQQQMQQQMQQMPCQMMPPMRANQPQPPPSVCCYQVPCTPCAPCAPCVPNVTFQCDNYRGTTSGAPNVTVQCDNGRGSRCCMLNPPSSWPCPCQQPETENGKVQSVSYQVHYMFCRDEQTQADEACVCSRIPRTCGSFGDVRGDGKSCWRARELPCRADKKASAKKKKKMVCKMHLKPQKATTLQDSTSCDCNGSDESFDDDGADTCNICMGGVPDYVVAPCGGGATTCGAGATAYGGEATTCGGGATTCGGGATTCGGGAPTCAAGATSCARDAGASTMAQCMNQICENNGGSDCMNSICECVGRMVAAAAVAAAKEASENNGRHSKAHKIVHAPPILSARQSYQPGGSTRTSDNANQGPARNWAGIESSGTDSLRRPSIAAIRQSWAPTDQTFLPNTAWLSEPTSPQESTHSQASWHSPTERGSPYSPTGQPHTIVLSNPFPHPFPDGMVKQRRSRAIQTQHLDSAHRGQFSYYTDNNCTQTDNGSHQSHVAHIKSSSKSHKIDPVKVLAKMLERSTSVHPPSVSSSKASSQRTSATTKLRTLSSKNYRAEPRHAKQKTEMLQNRAPPIGKNHSDTKHPHNSSTGEKEKRQVSGSTAVEMITSISDVEAPPTDNEDGSWKQASTDIESSTCFINNSSHDTKIEVDIANSTENSGSNITAVIEPHISTQSSLDRYSSKRTGHTSC